MPVDGFKRLYHDADRRPSPATVAVAGGDDPTVLEAMRIACDSGWVRPILVGPKTRIRELAAAAEIDLADFSIHDAEGGAVAVAAVALVKTGEAQALMKGQIATPALMKAVLHHDQGLRTGRVVCQVVLMEIPRDRRRFLLADTGISVQPTVDERIDILRSAVEVADALREPNPKVALMAASETVKPAMPETVESDEIVRRDRDGKLAHGLIEGPLSFDLAYAPDAGAKKQIDGSVVGAADIMLFPNLLSANLTVKAIMYTAHCKFGGVLRGTSAPHPGPLSDGNQESIQVAQWGNRRLALAERPPRSGSSCRCSCGGRR
jgi:phosphate butyryltransferase